MGQFAFSYTVRLFFIKNKCLKLSDVRKRNGVGETVLPANCYTP